MVHFKTLTVALAAFAATASAATTKSSSTKTATSATSAAASGLTPTPSPTPLTLKIKTKGGERNKTAPLLHGLFFEDINHSGDGGIYAELIRNRAFQENKQVPWAPTLTGWKPIGDAVLSLDVLNPLSDALTTVLRVDVPQTATGEVGFLNEGWWGMDIQPHGYNASFYIKPSQALYAKNVTHITASLRSNVTDDIWAAEKIAFPSKGLSTSNYTQFKTLLTPSKAAPSSNNTFALTFDAAEAAGQSFFFDLISLFPPTYKGRANGLRADLAQNLADLDPKFLRFPGGNNLEGYSIDTRWQWKKNIGPLIDRAGRPGDWTYYNTDGLGYLEFLEWCEDMDLEPLLTVYAGYSLDMADLNPANTVAPDDLDFYITEALEQLEYAMGDVSTTWGAKRAAHGHPEPFNIRFVEIGNEDWFSDSYYWRYPRFLSALSAAYPNITYIASQATETSPANRNTSIPAGGMWDLHHYETPQFFKDRFNFFDNWQTAANYTGVQIFVGEYSVLSRDRVGGVDWTNGEGRFTYPTTIAAIGEAIFALAMERNPGVATLSSYAPLFQNFNAFQWTPNFIGFAADPNTTVLSTSYYQQQMFARFQGAETLPVVNSGDFDPVWWHASIDDADERVFVKLVNAAKQPAEVTLQVDRKVRSVNGTSLGHADEYAFNYIGNATAISPKTFTLKSGAVRGGTVRYTLPGLSVVVLELK
ncbi:alpha-L-arabinofuranosidase A [Geopyxis carbonaria]|nr:alpha-L-arabinofuranosidase A [Geopyxis carbonaria]